MPNCNVFAFIACGLGLVFMTLVLPVIVLLAINRRLPSLDNTDFWTPIYMFGGSTILFAVISLIFRNASA